MSTIRDVTLDVLPELMAGLHAQVVRDFPVDVVVYLEEGARVPALHLARCGEWPVLPLRIQRPDSRWKRLARPILGRLPAAATAWLRQREANKKFHRRAPRVLAAGTPRADLAGRRVLIFDDAADSGSSLLMARAWVEECGARREDVRTAVITVTTPLGREVVDFTLFEGLCRFPWSADSAEERAHAALHRALLAEVEARRWSR